MQEDLILSILKCKLKMDIVSRIKRFLEAENFTVSQFADTCTIPRPTVSQLLNGRNKKVSDEIISKIHAAYPYLSISWLLFGEGEMFVKNNANDSALSDDSSAENLFLCMDGNTGDVNSNVAALSNEYIRGNFGVNACNSVNNIATGSSVNDNAENLQKNILAASGAQISSKSSVSDRKVVNIIVYYSDNSFEQFVPASRK